MNQFPRKNSVVLLDEGQDSIPENALVLSLDSMYVLHLNIKGLEF